LKFSRFAARRLALRALYIAETTQKDLTISAEALTQLRDETSDAKADLKFAKSILDEVFNHQTEIESLLQSVIHNWELERLAVIDRCILFMAAAEMMYLNTPPKVCINEAVNLAKTFGTIDSGAFVNGIMDSLMRKLKEDESKS